MPTIEYNIPKYTYTLSIPIEMIGMRPASEKAWDEMLATLTREDQKLWQEFRPKMSTECNDAAADYELIKAIPNYAVRKTEIEKGAKLTTEEERRLMNAYVDEWAKCLATSKISAAGQKKITGLMRNQVASEVTR